jgi:gamma-glutamyltranspeptidase/glutathione hydrolase
MRVCFGLHRKVWAIICFAVSLTWVQALAQSPAPAAPANAQQPAAAQPRGPVIGTRHMVAAAHPLAAAAGREILRQGGSAVDAAIAVQLVLTLVEPQSSGIGGGGFLMHYDASARQVESFDGRETAPAEATPEMFVDANGGLIPHAEAQVGGTAVATPGLLRMLELVHQKHGRLPWARLFEPAMRLAHDGFPISPRLAHLITQDQALRRLPATRAYFFDEAGNPRPAGHQLANEALFETLRTLANSGANAFYTGAIARDIVKAVRESPVRPGGLQRTDLEAYVAVPRPPVCAPFRVYSVCGMGPPSSGGTAVAQTLGILENFELSRMAPGAAETIHVFTEASRLANADRFRYLADADFVDVPVQGLLERDYLIARSRLIAATGRATIAPPGRPPGVPANASTQLAAGDLLELPGTTHVSVVDGAGNAVALTSSIENVFGSRIMVRGFLLNSHMTDFAFRPLVDNVPVVNRIEPRKRPRSAMAPTIVMNGENRLVAALGSPGGSRIIPYVARTLVATLEWGYDIQEAINLPLHVATADTVLVERNSALRQIIPALRGLGHNVEERSLASGLAAIVVLRQGSNGSQQLAGAVDPRREGEALGD